MQIGKGLLITLLIMSTFSGVGVYIIAVSSGVVATCIPYGAVDKMDYTLAPNPPKGKGR